MKVGEIIEQKIRGVLSPDRLEIINESHLHQGHSGDDGTGESHYKLIIVSSAFEGLGRVQRHKLIHQIIHEEAGRIHALSIEAYAVSEKP